MADEESFVDDGDIIGGSGEEIDEDDEYISENDDEEDLSILTKLKKTNKTTIVPIDKTYENYYNHNKTTSPFLTKFERAKLIGTRAEMLSAGSPALISVPNNITSPYDIALLEFNQKKIPLMIKRYLPNGDCEYLRLEDLTIL